MKKFKKGDVVRVANDTHQPELNGQLGVVREIETDSIFYPYGVQLLSDPDDGYYWFNDEEVEKANGEDKGR